MIWTIRYPDGTVWPKGELIFELTSAAFPVMSVYPRSPVTVTSGSDGSGSVDLVSGLGRPYHCTLPDGTTFVFWLPDDADVPIITLSELRNQEPIETPPDVTFITDHGQLTGLLDDDHPQYLNKSRADNLYVSFEGLQDEEAGLRDADIVLQAQLTNEQQARADGDLLLTESIDAELSARTLVDSGLQSQINALGLRVSALEIGGSVPDTFTLTINNGSGGAVGANVPGPYTDGTVVTLTPVPDSTHTFDDFDVDGLTVTDNPLVLTMSANHVVTASWTALPTPIVKSRVYANSSPWNTPIGGSPTLHASSAAFIAALTDRTFVGENNFQVDPTTGWLHFTSDPTQYAFPTYYVDPDVTGTRNVHYSGLFSDVSADGVETKYNGGGTAITPFAGDEVPSQGSDGSFVVRDKISGDIWGGWQLANASGVISSTNLYCERSGASGTGQQPIGFTSRGPGMGYEAGTIYAHEMIDALAGGHSGTLGHRLGFAYDIVTPRWVEPWATKSDGTYASPGMPEGALLQLDPSISEATVRARIATGTGLGGPSLTEQEILECLVLVKTAQVYGLVIVDHSGQRPGKWIPGGQETENWGVGAVPPYSNRIVTYIDPNWLRVLDFTDTNGFASDTTTGTVQWLDHYSGNTIFNTDAGGAFIRAEVGGTYSLNSSSKTLFGSVGGEGWVNCATVNSGRGWQLQGVNVRDVRSTHFWRPVALPLGAAHEFFCQLRVTDANGRTYYQVRGRMFPGSTLRLTLQAVTGGSAVALNSEFNTGLTYTDLSKYIGMTFEVLGASPTIVRARVWIATTPDETDVAQPSTWQVSVSDSAAALQSAGGAGLQYNLASGSTVAPHRFYTTFWRGVAL